MELGQPDFTATANGFAATHTQHKVQLNSELLVQGAVRVTTRDGLVLHSTPSGIGLYDAASGKPWALADRRIISVAFSVAVRQDL